MPPYAFNRSGSSPVDHRSRLGDPCNIPIILLILCECFPERVPCLIEYLKATQLFPRPYPRFTSYVYTKYTRPYNLWLPLGITFWAKGIVIVATYCRVVTLLPSSLGLFSDHQRRLLVPQFGLSITLWSLGLDEYLSWNCCNACIAVSSNISNCSQEFSAGPYPSQAIIYCPKSCGNLDLGFPYHRLSTTSATT